MQLNATKATEARYKEYSEIEVDLKNLFNLIFVVFAFSLNILSSTEKNSWKSNWAI